MDSKNIFGIDYGSKLAGTTVVAYLEEESVKWHCSEKKKDADHMILKLIESHEPTLVAIDAPLSLPGVYRGLKGYDNHFYRQCDRELKAMSPMFLGGLTARAMKLAAGCQMARFIEVYPVKTGKTLGLEKYGYRTKEAETEQILNELLKLRGWSHDATTADISPHHIDALLALITGYEQAAGNGRQAGNSQEGIIYY